MLEIPLKTKFTKMVLRAFSYFHHFFFVIRKCIKRKFSIFINMNIILKKLTRALRTLAREWFPPTLSNAYGVAH